MQSSAILKLCVIAVIVILYISFLSKEERFTDIHVPVMYGRMSCPYTKDMVEQLDSDETFKKFVFIDTATEEGNALLTEAGGSGVPYFVRGSRSAVGKMPTSELLNKLDML